MVWVQPSSRRVVAAAVLPIRLKWDSLSQLLNHGTER